MPQYVNRNTLDLGVLTVYTEAGKGVVLNEDATLTESDFVVYDDVSGKQGLVAGEGEEIRRTGGSIANNVYVVSYEVVSTS